MKPNYKKKTDRNNKFYYTMDFGYHRAVRTFGELRDNEAVWSDKELRDLHVYPRRCRAPSYLDSWNDFNISRAFKKSWKDFTKHRKQWMMASEKPPEPAWGVVAPKWRKSSEGCPEAS